MGQVLFINHTGQIGGAEIGLLDVAECFAGRSHAVLFDDGPLRGKLEAMGIGVTIISAGKGMMNVRRHTAKWRLLLSVPSVMAQALRLAKIARKFDVLYPNTQKSALLTMLVQPLTRRPIVWHLHDILSADHFGTAQRRLMTFLANRAARQVIAISQACKRAFVESGGVPDKAVIVMNGVDVDRFEAPGQPDPAQLRAELGLTDKPVVGLFGRISPWKGQAVLIEALTKAPTVHAMIVGGALFGEGDYENELHALADRLGVQDRVHWLGHRSDVPALMRATDIVLHGSTSAEPFGRVIVEGMLAKRPVLASDDGASREILGEDYLGLVQPGDPAALAVAIRTMLDLPAEKWTALVNHNYQRAIDVFSSATMTAHIERVVDLPA